ncbi:hypothetical protein EVA_12732, partial [gut metagenome]
AEHEAFLSCTAGENMVDYF